MNERCGCCTEPAEPTEVGPKRFADGNAYCADCAYALLNAEAEQLTGQLVRAVALLREFGACDPYSGQPYDEVTEFLAGLDA